MAVGKEIKTQIASIQSTQKITSAMEMVAASKMRKAQDRMHESRPYAEKMRQVIAHLAKSNPEYKHLYLQQRELKRVGYIVVSSDRGLCGGLNINVFKKTVQAMSEKNDSGVEIDVCAIGSKSASFFNNYGGNVVASKTHLGDKAEAAELIGAVKVMLDNYDEGRLDALYV
ncbi:MAG: F0F1 ATP synthase subunit gamma, partial [Gammaproteobacteria bacterium]|nr:F0F1 ATP synthase subunit gamma [Gammaproteobacteria bacterium]